MAKLSGGSNKEKEDKKQTFAKSNSKYWLTRVFKPVAVKGGERIESPSYSARLMFEGRRQTFPLGLGSQREASIRAAKIYKSLIAHGWAKTLEDFGKATDIAGEATLGALFEAVEAVSPARARTIRDYENALRAIAAEIKGLKKDASRFDYATGGAAVWREKVDRIKLRELTSAKVDKWRREFVRTRAADPEKERRAKTSANSLLRQASSLFGAKIVKRDAEGGNCIEFVDPEGNEKRLRLPDPLPLAGAEFYKGSDTRYVSKIDAPSLLTAAITELGEPEVLTEEDKQGMSKPQIAYHAREEGRKPEALKIFLLSLLAGLRRNEIDKLLWDQIDFERGEIEIRATKWFRPKSEKSAGVVEIDPELVDILRGYRARATGAFVIESDNAAKVDPSSARYRAERSFRLLGKWLKKKGIDARKPIHTLRKEFGSLVVQRQGLYAASQALRHAGIGVTAAFYADKKERLSTGLGGVLKPKNVVEADTARRKAE